MAEDHPIVLRALHKRRKTDRSQRLRDICLSGFLSAAVTASGCQIRFNTANAIVEHDVGKMQPKIDKLQTDIDDIKASQVQRQHFDATAGALSATVEETKKAAEDTKKTLKNKVVLVTVVPMEKMAHPTSPAKPVKHIKE